MDAGAEDDAAPVKFESGRKVGQRYEVVEKLDEGGFGQVYKVKDLQSPNVFAALKVESTDMDGGSAIKLEMNVLSHMNKKVQSPHFPMIITAKKHKKYCYMVMELLGKNLKVVKNMYASDIMPIADWARLAIQCLHSIKTMHDRGFVHRDIKPANFVMGHNSDLSKIRIVHVLDFGLARAYAFFKGQRWEPRKARKHIDFRGTFRYASPNMHRAEDLGRRDDMYSLMYMLIELHVGLPWQKDTDNETIEAKKLHMEENPKNLVLKFPVELHGVLPHLKTLTFYSRPDYMLIYNGLLEMLKRLNVKMTDKFEYETEEDYKAIKTIESTTKRRCCCEDERESMAADPIKINAPPTNFVFGENSNTRDDFNHMKKTQIEIAKAESSAKVSKSDRTNTATTSLVPPVPAPASIAQKSRAVSFKSKKSKKTGRK